MSVYDTFDHIQDEELKARNRGVMMANIYEDNIINGNNLSMSGTKAMISYFNRIPNDEKVKARAAFASAMRERGYMSVA